MRIENIYSVVFSLLILLTFGAKVHLNLVPYLFEINLIRWYLIIFTSSPSQSTPQRVL